MFLVLKDFLTLGFFVYFDDLAVGGSADCEDDYVQFGRDILFITSYRSDKFCHRIQVSTLGSTVQYWSVQYSPSFVDVFYLYYHAFKHGLLCSKSSYFNNVPK